MSLYEVIDQFVATGVLAFAPLVGAGLPSASRLDGAAFSEHMRHSKLCEPYGAALDALGHVVWFARERHGITSEIAQSHAAKLAHLLGEVRLTDDEITSAFAEAQSNPVEPAAGPSARLTALWLEKAAACGALERAEADPEVCSFLLSQMLALIVDRSMLLKLLAPDLIAFRESLVRRPPLPVREITAPNPPAPVAETQLSSLSTLHASPPSLDLPEGALKRFKAILAQQPMSREQRLARLDELGAWLQATVAHLRKPTNEPAAMRAAKLEAAGALEAGDLERAMELLKSVREHMRAGRRRTEARIAEELHALREQMKEEAAATVRLGELALARMDLDAAADHFADAAGQLPANESETELSFRLRQAETLASKSELTGDERAIAAAAQAFRTCRGLLSAATDPQIRVRINVGLGDMLLALGARRAGEAISLDEAAAAFAEAVAGIDRAAKPMQWALVQLSNAAALIELGKRTDREHNWRTASTLLMPALEVFETRGASDLAAAARAKLQAITTSIEQNAQPTMIAPPAKSA